MTTYRSRHWTDIEIAGPDRSRRRRIGNHINYVTPSGLILPTQANIAASGPPSNWVGQWDFRDHSGAAPLQFSAHDTSDPDNRAMIGLRIDDTPDVWVNYKAMDVAPGVETQSPSDTVREWPGLWANTTLRWTHGGHFAKQEIVLSAPGHPASFRTSARTSPGSTWDVTDGILTISQGGVVKMRTKPVYGYDAAGNYIRATLTLDDTWGPGGAYPILRLTPNADDLAGATYPVTIDPTTNIPETAVTDSSIYSGGASTYNYGGATFVAFRNAASYRQGLLRFDESLIPAGTITDLHWNIHTVGAYTADWETYKIAAANASWPEGTATGSTQTGSCCYDYHTYDASTPTNWAGSAGLLTSGTDYIADATPPALSGSVNGDEVWSFGSDGAAWATDWRDTPSNNAGHIVRSNSATAHSIVSTEGTTAAERPNYDIDYTAVGGQPAWIRWTPIHVAGRGGFARGSF